MQERIDQVMTRRLHAEQLAIDHVGNPCQRMPIRSVSRAKCPRDIGPGQACGNVRVFEDVIAVVNVDKVMADSRQIAEKRQKTEQEEQSSARLGWLDVHGERSPFWGAEASWRL